MFGHVVLLQGNPLTNIALGVVLLETLPLPMLREERERGPRPLTDEFESVSGGLRGNIMRTPGQRHQNFAVEGLMNEAAASAGADTLQFRINHITDQRLIDILNATANLILLGHKRTF
jgi:hypothetical protein